LMLTRLRPARRRQRTPAEPRHDGKQCYWNLMTSRRPAGKVNPLAS
jgi:hypothetical protein